MAFTITNLLATSLYLHKLLKAGVSVEVSELSEKIIKAARKTDNRDPLISAVPAASDKLATLTAESDAQTAFDLPLDMPSDDSVLIILNGRILTEATDFTFNNSTNTLTYLGTDLVTGDELVFVGTSSLVSGAKIKTASISSDKLDEDAQAITKQLKFGEAVEVDTTHQWSEIQIADADGTSLSKEVVVKLTCDGSATLSLITDGNGTIVSGDGTDEMEIKTASNGKFDLEITDATAESVTIKAGVTQGSSIVDCSDTLGLTFSGT